MVGSLRSVPGSKPSSTVRCVPAIRPRDHYAQPKNCRDLDHPRATSSALSWRHNATGSFSPEPLARDSGYPQRCHYAHDSITKSAPTVHGYTQSGACLPEIATIRDPALDRRVLPGNCPPQAHSFGKVPYGAAPEAVGQTTRRTDRPSISTPSAAAQRYLEGGRVPQRYSLSVGRSGCCQSECARAASQRGRPAQLSRLAGASSAVPANWRGHHRKPDHDTVAVRENHQSG